MCSLQCDSQILVRTRGRSTFGFGALPQVRLPQIHFKRLKMPVCPFCMHQISVICDLIMCQCTPVHRFSLFGKERRADGTRGGGFSPMFIILPPPMYMGNVEVGFFDFENG